MQCVSCFVSGISLKTLWIKTESGWKGHEDEKLKIQRNDSKQAISVIWSLKQEKVPVFTKWQPKQSQ